MAHLFIAADYGVRDDISVTALSRMPDVFVVEKQEEDEQQATQEILTVVSQALEKYAAMRTAEGAALEADLRSRAKTVLELVSKVEARSPVTLAEYRARLTQKMQEVLQNTNIDEGRILQEAAIYAGLEKAKGDYVVMMDADLQDDIDALDQFVTKFREGCDVVYGVRNRRDTDTAFKRGTALMFYRLMKALGVDITYNHADYRLMSARALEALSQFGEVNLFLRGLAPLVGFQSDVVTYDRSERFAGESKYPFKKMLAFAIDGITSFSVKPLRLITTVGVIIFMISLLMLLYTLVSWIAGHAVLGWTSTLASIWLIGGLIMLSLGIVGEYVGKIYMESKHRPRYRIETTL